MRIFVSWSGTRSKKVADYLNAWLRKLPLSIETWVSGEAIEPGTRWEKELSEALEGTEFGILCLTPENQHEPWICFESGALSKTLQKSRVVPYLIGMELSELKHPLKQFHAIEANKEDTWKLIKSIYKVSGDQTLSENDVLESFEVWWPKLGEQINSALSDFQIEQMPKEPDSNELLSTLERIGAVVESLSARFMRFESNIGFKTAQPPIPMYRVQLTGTPVNLDSFVDWIDAVIAHNYSRPNKLAENEMDITFPTTLPDVEVLSRLEKKANELGLEISLISAQAGVYDKNMGINT